MELTHLSLFSGIGGLDLAAEWAGFETVGQVEWADYPTKVLEKHWAEVPRWRDIRSVTAEGFYERTGLRTVDIVSGGFPCQPFSVAGKRKGKDDDRYLWPEMLRVISELKPSWVIGENVAGIVTMGESAPFSELENDDVGSTTENMVLEEICEALENLNYEVQPLLIPACSVGAPHQRYRTFIVGYSEHNGQPAEQELRGNETAGNQRRQEKSYASGEFEGTDRPIDESGICRGESRIKRLVVGNSNGGNVETVRQFQGGERTKPGRICSDVPDANDTGNGASASGINEYRQEKNKGWREQPQHGISGLCENVADTDNNRLEKYRHERGCTELHKCGASNKSGNFNSIRKWWAIEPNVGRVANGVSSRVDRLKCLGNAVVPQQAYPIFKAIADIENEVY